MSCYVGIDQSYTGFAFVVLDADGNLVQEHLKNFEAKLHGTGIDRLLAVYQHVSNLLSECEDVAHVCMEGYSSASKFGREAAGELGAIVKLAIYDYFDRFAYAHDHLRYPTIVQPSTLKKFVTGNGGAKKSGMMLAIFKKWGYETTDDNLADAYALAKVAYAIDTTITDFIYEKTALAVVKPHTKGVAEEIPN